MSFLKRLSDGFWDFVSPHKSPRTETPRSAPPKFKRPLLPTRRRTLEETVKSSRSMSPTARITSWKTSAASEDGEITVSPPKRKRSATPRTPASVSHRSKRFRKMDSMDVYSSYDLSMDDLDMADPLSKLQILNSPASESDMSEVFVDDSHFFTDDQWKEELERRKKTFEPPEAEVAFSEAELLSEGWTDEFVQLKRRIVMRGREAILPEHYRYDFGSLPDGLFCKEPDAPLRSLQGKRMHGIKSLKRLFDMGGHVRDGLSEIHSYNPEHQTMKFLKEYLKWARQDSSLDSRTCIPVIALVSRPGDTPVPVLEQIARRKLARLTERYVDGLCVQRSIELSPSSEATRLACAIPQLYAIIASGPIAILAAYRPDLEKDLHPVVVFDFTQIPLDGWTSLTFALIICHCRDVQVRIAEDTGLGMPIPGKDEEMEDPDL